MLTELSPRTRRVYCRVLRSLESAVMRSSLRAFIVMWLALAAAGTLMVAAVALIFADEDTHLLAAIGVCVLVLAGWAVQRTRRVS